MNVTEKIFAFHDVSRKGWVRPGEAILVSVDWVLSSEASWHVGTILTYKRLLQLTNVEYAQGISENGRSGHLP